MARLANEVRQHYPDRDRFGRDWSKQHPGAWQAPGWAAGGQAYGTPSWGDVSGYAGYGSSSQPYYYDYGSNAVSDNGSMYVNGDAVGTQQEYAQQAATIADTGKQAPATQEEEWLALGVFAIVQGEQGSGNDLFQLAVNKAGVIRGNYYNGLSDTTLTVYGSADKKTQRAAWTIGDRKEPVFEAGFANLTKSETTMLVHFGKDRAEQWTLVRLNPPSEPK